MRCVYVSCSVLNGIVIILQYLLLGCSHLSTHRSRHRTSVLIEVRPLCQDSGLSQNKVEKVSRFIGMRDHGGGEVIGGEVGDLVSKMK